MSESEIILLKRFTASGDSEAFAQIITQHVSMVYSVCLRILLDKDKAADAVQDTFLQLIRKADSITDSLPNWLHRVAVNRAKELIRMDSLRKNRESRYIANHNDIGTNDEKAIWNEISGYIDEELEILDDQTREVIILRFFEGLSTIDIAGKCNISQPTVSRRIDSGIELLRQKLKSRGVIVPAALFITLLTDNVVTAAPALVMKELGKLAIAGSKASIGSHITTGLSIAKIKVIAASVVVVLAGLAFVYYNQIGASDVNQQASIVSDISIDELADICQAMEESFRDISVEYEFGVEPAPTIEDIKGTGFILTVGTTKEKMSTKRPFDERSLSTVKGKYMNEYEQTFEQTTMESYNGKIAKHLITGGLYPSGIPEISLGTITKRKDFIPTLATTPIAFSVLRFGYEYEGHENKFLSERLRNKEFVRLVKPKEKINGFNTICAELLWDAPNVPFIHKNQPQYKIYFSVDHGYTPVKYEQFNPSETEPVLVHSVNVTSLEKVADNLWFPGQGYLVAGENLVNTYKASKIVVNQGLTDENFDIEFPPNTRITNEIEDSNDIDNLTEE